MLRNPTTQAVLPYNARCGTVGANALSTSKRGSQASCREAPINSITENSATDSTLPVRPAGTLDT
jgi:hypothetical protein